MFNSQFLQEHFVHAKDHTCLFLTSPLAEIIPSTLLGIGNSPFQRERLHFIWSKIAKGEREKEGSRDLSRQKLLCLEK